MEIREMIIGSIRAAMAEANKDDGPCPVDGDRCIYNEQMNALNAKRVKLQLVAGEVVAAAKALEKLSQERELVPWDSAYEHVSSRLAQCGAMRLDCEQIATSLEQHATAVKRKQAEMASASAAAKKEPADGSAEERGEDVH